MNELLTAAQMRAIEQAAIDSGAVTGLELMERAGAGVVEAIYEEWPAFAEAGWGPAPTPPEYLGQDEKQKPLKAVVLCGPGNNGGDGFVVARLLHQRGWVVEVLLYGDADKLPPDARVNYEKWCEVGEVLPWEKCTSDRWGRHPLVIEALFGTGLTREVPDDIRNVLLATLNCRRVAVDLPCFINSDTGALLMEWPQNWSKVSAAHVTVTFHSHKPGHFLGAGPALCGKVVVKSIGLEFCYEALGATTAEVFPYLIGKLQGQRLSKTPSAHKFSHGHALVLSGGPAHTGAARLAARGALRIGAGLVTLGVPPAAQQEVASQVTAVMLKRVRDADALSDVLQDKRINALCLGPALGLGEREENLIRVTLESGRNCVLDADALTLIAGDKGLFEKLHPGCVLTPHGGEFARLFPDIAAKLDAPATKGPAYSKIDATREAAKRAGCTVLFKGPDTVIADQTGVASVNAAVYDRAAPWLATAGSGDVLAGFIAGLLARGFSPVHAAESAVWLHVECARHFGPGLIAEDLPEQLPAVLQSLSGSDQGNAV
ncbi:NAD(P)H-hydrate dehydratase [Thalassobius sp. I31.1]|uniref:NAD(P)H-hydrate dehydratase n=1 Tax=Thalassobius sp. I31.1 TaxID=2109912 RepID=UPI000D19E5B7|nr:NAD(P)H-hydrate dehydratase [Thalassobius sp. I31.1]